MANTMFGDNTSSNITFSDLIDTAFKANSNNNPDTVNLNSVRDTLCKRIENLQALSYPISCFYAYPGWPFASDLQKYVDMVTEEQRKHGQIAFNKTNEAINAKRSGDLIKSNELYIESTAFDDMFESGVVWGWFKVMLLTKNFSDAYVLLNYYHAIEASRNILIRKDNTLDFSNIEDPKCFLTLDFDSNAVFCCKTDIWNLTHEAVVDKIRAFGGSELWSSYSLSDAEYANFTKYFG